MSDTEYARLIRAAQEKARSSFTVLFSSAIRDAEHMAADRRMDVKSGSDPSMAAAVSHCLRQDGKEFLLQAETLFSAYLDRAMQTMYIDLRPGMRQPAIDELSLIDDEAMSRQIEVGRLTQRMRDENEESIGRLNVIISRMHGEHEARERENPFRPYLLARVLYETIYEKIDDERKAKALFEHLSHALIAHLPAYYSGIREVFESSGVRARFVAQPSKAAHHQRYFGAPRMERSEEVDARVMPGLLRVLENLQGFSSGQGSVPSTMTTNGAGQPLDLQGFIHKMFSPGRLAGKSSAALAPANPLMAQLNRHQQLVRQKQVAGSPAQTEDLWVLREQMDLSGASVMERMTIDVIAILFEFIRSDEQISVELRKHFGNLQVPLLKAAVLDSRLLHDEQHPARRLLNRLGSIAIAADPASPAGRKVTAGIERVVSTVLDDFDTDPAVFERCAEQLEGFADNLLQQADKQVALGVKAMDVAEKSGILLSHATQRLADLLMPLGLDKRISDFLIAVWPRVLIKAVRRDATSGVSSVQDSSLFYRCRSILPDLLWSIAEKKDPQQRAAMIRLLPDLVKRFRQALEMIRLREQDSRDILDLLVDVHTQILRGGKGAISEGEPSLERFRDDFARLVMNWDEAAWHTDAPPPMHNVVVEEVFASVSVNAELKLDVREAKAGQAERDMLLRDFLPGARVTFASSTPDGARIAGMLVGISRYRSLYLFRTEPEAPLVLYSHSALLKALGDETVVPLEYAPIFERAVESLLYRAENFIPTQR